MTQQRAGQLARFTMAQNNSTGRHGLLLSHMDTPLSSLAQQSLLKPGQYRRSVGIVAIRNCVNL